MNNPSPKPGQQGQFNALRIAIIVIPIAIVIGGVVLFIAYGGLDFMSSSGGGSLVEVKGKITFQGEPVKDAAIDTLIEGSDGLGSIGQTDQQGNYSLMTSTDGPYENGAFEGKHKVTIKVQVPNPGVGPPSLASPEKFAEFDSTPLIIEVKSGGSTGADIKLEDHMTADEIKAFEEKVASGATGGPVAQMLGNLDSDEDGKLSMEEVEAADEQFRDRIKAADSNEDGFVDEAELNAMLVPNMRPGGDDGEGDDQGRGGQGRGGQGRGGRGGGEGRGGQGPGGRGGPDQ